MVFGQSAGTITGRVVDQTAAVVGGAEVNCSIGNTNGLDGAVLAAPLTGGNSAHYSVSTSSGNVGTTNCSKINMFANPAQVAAEFGSCILGIDTNCGSTGMIRGMGTWNVDATLSKDLGIRKERVGATLLFQFTNVFNHVQLYDPSLSLAPRKPLVS